MAEKLKRCRYKYLILVFPIIFLVLLCLMLSGMRIVFSNSLPPGIYWVTGRKAGRGDIAQFPIRNSRVNRMLMKKVYGLSGDVVAIDRSGVTVNSVMVKNSTPQPVDSKGEHLQIAFLGNYVLKADEALMMSDYHPESYDGRYFGVIKAETLSNAIELIIAF